MRKTIIATWALACSAVLGAGVAQAAGADLAVKGTLQPGACNVALSNGGSFDLGPLDGSALNSDSATIFRDLWLTLSIDCRVPTKVALRLVDNRPGTHFGGDLYGFNNNWVYGLGLSGGRKIGEYLVSLYEAEGDGDSARFLFRDVAPEWSGPDKLAYFTYDGEVSFTNVGGESNPAAFKNLSAQAKALVYINKTSELDLSQEIQIDGSSTLELFYV